MWTWAFSFATLAFILQAVVGLPSFGTGEQVEDWNEVDNEHPGEILPRDYMMPKRDPREINGGHPPSKPIGKFTQPLPDNAATEKTDTEPTPEELPAPHPTPRPPTERSEDLGAHSSIPTPSKTTRTDGDKGELEYNIPALKPTPRLSTTETSEDKVEQTTNQRTSTDQVPKEKTDTPAASSTTPTSVEDDKKKDQRPILTIKIRRLSDPAPENNEEVECDCEECAENQAAQTANGNVETNEKCDEENPSKTSPQLTGSEILPVNTRVNEAAGSSPLSLLRVGKKDEQLEDIFKDVASMLRAMPGSDKKTLFQSLPFSQDEENKMGNSADGKNMPNIIARIIMRVSTNAKRSVVEEPSTLTMPCNMDEGSQENPSGDFYFKKDNAFPTGQTTPEVTLPAIKGVMLKSLVPRDFFAMKDLLNTLKTSKMADINKESELNELKMSDPFLKAPSRFVAVINKGSRDQLPPLYFPYDQAKPAPTSLYPDFPPLTRSQIPADDIVRQFLGGWSPPRKVQHSNPFEFNMLKNAGEYNDHIRNFDPQISDVMSLLLTKLADQESSALKNIRLPSQDRPLPEEEADSGNLHVRRRKIVMAFNK